MKHPAMRGESQEGMYHQMHVIEADVVVVGAGPAGLATTLSLVRRGFPGSVVVLDAGNHYGKRRCPVDLQSLCRGCGGICNVVSGFGGSIHYGDGVKLSRFPSGRRLQRILGRSAENHMEEALELFLGDQIAERFCWPLAEFDGIELKSYPVMSLKSDQVALIVERLYERVIRSNNVDLRLASQARHIEPMSNGFEVIVNARQGHAVECFRTKKVVVAVGRKGQRWWHSEVRRLNLGHALPVPSVGVRFECPREFLAFASKVHPDFKATMHADGVKIKTFCFCAGDGGGRIKFTDYGHYTLLDGHVVSESKSGPANFALLAQLTDEGGSPRSLKWIDQHLIEPYRALRDDRPGKPVMQWYPDFRDRQLTCDSMVKFINQAGFVPSLSDYVTANLAAVLPAPIHRSICRVFERLLSGFVRELAPALTFGDCAERVAVMGIELEGLWDEIRVTSSMESTIDGLYVCGDCSGHAQGILQAAASGVAAAASCANTRSAENLDHGSWSV